MDESEIFELKEKGYLKIRVIFEMLGKPKEHIQETLKKYIENFKTDTTMFILKEFYGEPKEQQEGLFSTFAEIEMLVANMQKITWLSLNFMPANIEILEPEEIKVSNREVGLWVNDVLSKLHEISLMTKSLVSKDKVIARTLGTLMKNMVLIVLDKPKDENEIFRSTGIREEELKIVIAALIKEGRLKEEDGKYLRIKKG
jgi:hypothetical protein